MGSSSAVKLGIYTGIAFGVLFGGYMAIVQDPMGGILAGVIAGPLFGLGMGLFFAWMARRTAANRPAMGEDVIREGPANHVAGVESRGGWLYLTDTALHFRAHKVNLQRHALTIALADIVDLAPARSLGLFPNAFTVTTGQRGREKFIVGDRKAWIAAIQQARQRPRTAAPADPPAEAMAGSSVTP
ncbi:MAG: hypothetical protein ACFCVH_00930 [Alphaproteobacteria bacterium]